MMSLINVKKNKSTFLNWFRNGSYIYPLILTWSIVLFAIATHIFKIPVLMIPSFTFLFTIPLILWLEHKTPFRKEWNKNHGDFFHDCFQTLFMFPLVGLGVLKLHQFFHAQFGSVEWTWMNILKSQSFFLQAFVVFIFAEFLNYFAHRLVHSIPRLSKLHFVHHATQRLYWGNAARFHIFDSAIEIFFYSIPLYFISATPEVTAFILSINATIGTMEHANIKTYNPWLSKIINTNELHFLHHSSKKELSQKNFGKVLSVFDLIFNTYHYDTREVESLETNYKSSGNPLPHTFWGQTIFPFIDFKK